MALALSVGALTGSCTLSGRGPAAAGSLAIPSGLDRHRPVPEASPLTRERVDLGERLFFDPVLSLDRSIACASCHVPEQAFTNGRAVSVGVSGRTGRRNVPTLVNRAYGRSFFWDGRTTGLEQQVLRPIEDSLEMALPLDEAIERLRDDPRYDERFRDVFRAAPDTAGLAVALASYVRTVLSGDTRYDRWVGGDAGALTAEERSGFDLFRGKAGCVACHVPPTFTDEQFHNTGVALRGQVFADSGRALVTHDPRDVGAFKTPTLRELDRTAPYMHDGSFATLEEVIEFYDRGGNRSPHIDPQIHPLGLSKEERRDLLAFLRSLSG
ncbi:MAG: cytochrome c peroxidase [Gemmatimonadota bacterium]|nr:cytochrome c peroxidase [Gemmatimonadota bacterium]